MTTSDVGEIERQSDGDQMRMQMSGLGACHCCGLVHQVPTIDARSLACCTRCQTVIKHGAHPRSSARAGAWALSALILYPLALTLPIMQIERFGYQSDASIWSGMVGLFAEGHLFVAVAVLVFSVIAPIGKLGMLFTLCIGQRLVTRSERARLYTLIELVGRWGMVDVLLVAVLVAVVKLGDLVTVTPGPGVMIFGAVVILSLIASAMFDPHAIWEDDKRQVSEGS
jgi:paraquat-inducible protein A